MISMFGSSPQSRKKFKIAGWQSFFRRRSLSRSPRGIRTRYYF